MDNNTSRRAIISVTQDDCKALVYLLDQAERHIDHTVEKGEERIPLMTSADEWKMRIWRIREHMTDRVPVHYTDLGIEL